MYSYYKRSQFDESLVCVVSNSKVRQLAIQVRERRMAIWPRSIFFARQSLETTLHFFTDFNLKSATYDTFEKKWKAMQWRRLQLRLSKMSIRTWRRKLEGGWRRSFQVMKLACANRRSDAIIARRFTRSRLLRNSNPKVLTLRPGWILKRAR